jgi:ferritin
MISKELNDEMNKQIVEELHSAYIYMGMAAWAEDKGLYGFAKFMQTHAESEEFKHAMKFVKFIQEAGGEVKYGAIGKVTTVYEDVEAVLKAAIKHEQHISARCKLIYELALEKKDYYAIEMMTWFLEEQMEEENLFEDLLTAYELTGKKDGYWDRHVKHPE